MSSHGVREHCSDGGLPPPGRLWRRMLPVFISLCLLAWLAYRIPFGHVITAARQVDWRLVVPLTMSAVVALYLWDSQCIRWVFTQSAGRIDYRSVLRARGSAYLAGALNYSAGQGVLAWLLARSLKIPVVAALGRMLLIAYHDLWLLFGLGLIGSFIQTDSRLRSTRLICEIGLVV